MKVRNKHLGCETGVAHQIDSSVFLTSGGVSPFIVAGSSEERSRSRFSSISSSFVSTPLATLCAASISRKRSTRLGSDSGSDGSEDRRELIWAMSASKFFDAPTFWPFVWVNVICKMAVTIDNCGVFTAAMPSLSPCFKKLINSLPADPLDPQIIDNLVKKALEDSNSISSIENRKSQWEYLLKNEVFTLAVSFSSIQSITPIHILCGRQRREKL